MNHPIHLLTLVYMVLFVPFLCGNRTLPLFSRVKSFFPVELEGGQARPQVIVTFPGLVPVAIRRATVPGVIVPATATQNPQPALRQNPKSV